MNTKFMIPIEVKNQTLFNRNVQKKNLYQIAGTVCQHFCEINKTYADILIKIEIWSKDYLTEKLKKSYSTTEFVMFNGNEMSWEFMNDFDEGEDAIVITNICYLFEVFEDED